MATTTTGCWSSSSSLLWLVRLLLLLKMMTSFSLAFLHNHQVSLLLPPSHNPIIATNPTTTTTNVLYTSYSKSHIKRNTKMMTLFDSPVDADDDDQNNNDAVTTTRPKIGSIVTIECKLLPEGDFVPEPLIDGIVIHEDDPPVHLKFVLGEGNYLPGLHDLVAKMSIQQTFHNVSLDAGWGSWNPNLQASITAETLEKSGLDMSLMKPGVELILTNGMKAVVKEVLLDDDGSTTFVIDANPPMAGASYLAYVKLIQIENGPSSNLLLYTPNYPDNNNEEEEEEEGGGNNNKNNVDNSKYQYATFALGCFWGGELAFMREKGVIGTKVGYTQGHTIDPTYKEVCTGQTGHTEAFIVTFDPTIVSYDHLVHLAMDRLGENKYLLNQVGNDKGTQYRHGIYYHTDEQKDIAEHIVQSYGEDCVTEVKPATIFYDAELYHQQYLLKGGQSARKGDDTAIRCYG